MMYTQGAYQSRRPALVPHKPVEEPAEDTVGRGAPSPLSFTHRAPTIPTTTTNVADNEDFRLLRTELFPEGRKQRRRSSDTKPPLGDHIGTNDIPAVVKIMKKTGDEVVNFADIVLKINKRNKMQSRILLITENGICNIEPNNYKLRRRIPFTSLGSVGLSHQSDNFFILRVREEYDYLLVSSKKVELITRLAQAYAQKMKRALHINFSDNLEYNVDSETTREMIFSRAEAGVSTQIVASGKKKGRK